MNVLINPPEMKQMGYTPPPLGLLYLAANDPDTRIADLALHGSQFAVADEPVGVVGCTMLTPTRHSALFTLKNWKENNPGVTTVAGGVHVSLMTKQLVDNYPFVDYWVVGDGERAWKRLCEGERPTEKVIVDHVENLDSLPMPAWDRIDINQYPARGSGVHRGNDLSTLPRVSIVLGRGCEGSCTFCSTWWVNGKYRYHGREWMRQEIDYLWDAGVRHLVFQDDNLCDDRLAFTRLCQILDYYNFSWFGCARVDNFSLELARMAKDAGCYQMSFGIESGSKTILASMHKKTTLEQALDAREACRQAGITFTALMMGGYPGETPETRFETEQFLARLQPDDIGSMGYTFVLPGTHLYAECKRQGMISDDYWLGPDEWFIYPHR